MKRIILVRHAKSSWDYPHLADADRPLGSRGLRDAPIMAQYLRSKNINGELWLVSSSVRTIETARIFQRVFLQPENTLKTLPELYHASGHQLLSVVQQLADTVASVVIFGHNPGFTDYANLLCQDSGYIDNIPTCAIAGIDLPVDQWKAVKVNKGKRVFFYLPRQIVKQTDN